MNHLGSQFEIGHGHAAAITREERHRLADLAHQSLIALRDMRRFLQERHTRCDSMDMDRLSDHKLFDSEEAFTLFWELDRLIVRLEAHGA